MFQCFSVSGGCWIHSTNGVGEHEVDRINDSTNQRTKESLGFVPAKSKSAASLEGLSCGDKDPSFPKGAGTFFHSEKAPAPFFRGFFFPKRAILPILVSIEG